MLLALACVACASLWAPSLADAHPLVGIADERLAMFSDPRFLALGITEVRYDMAWNTLSSGGYARAELSAWLANAHADGLTPLITIDHAAGREWRELPSVGQYSRAFLAFHALYPWVTQFATWNETNYYAQPISEHVALAARYYLALREDCPTCTILGGDLLDGNDRTALPMASYVREFDRDAHRSPTVWGVHDYVNDADLSAASIKALLDATRADLWFTETGVLLDFYHGRQRIRFSQNAAHGARVMRYILDTLGSLSPRVKRIYLSEWSAQSATDRWDSALISYTGVPRPAYDQLARTLLSWGDPPDCAISRVPPTCPDVSLPATPP